MSEHSPGPWKWDGGLRIYDATDEQVAKVEASDADARLIAAAPELLDLVRRYERGCCCHPTDGLDACPECREAAALLARIDGGDRG